MLAPRCNGSNKKAHHCVAGSAAMWDCDPANDRSGSFASRLPANLAMSRSTSGAARRAPPLARPRVVRRTQSSPDGAARRRSTRGSSRHKLVPRQRYAAGNGGP
jgi:hypothetical protein